MIVKGKSRSNGTQLGAYLLSEEVNEDVRVLDISGMATSDLTQALIEMQEITDRGQRGVKGLYHAVISPQPGYHLKEEQWLYAADALGKQLKYEHQPRAIVLHEKADGQGGVRTHAHVVFQRTDKERLTLLPDSWNYIAHERAARHLEAKFGHEIVPGKHVEPKQKDIEKQPSPEHERHQEERAGLSKEARIDQVTSLFHQSDGAKGFAASLAHAGYTLANGDRRDFVILDKAGQVYSLPRCIEGVKTKELRKFFEPLETKKLPSVDEAKQFIRDSQKVRQERNAKKDKAKDAFECSSQPEAVKDVNEATNKADAQSKDREKDKGPPSEKQSLASKARKAFAFISATKKLPDYGQALAERLVASKSLAQSVKAKLGNMYDRIASQIGKSFARASSLIGQSKSDTKGLRIAKPKEPNGRPKEAFNKASKALDLVNQERIQSKDQHKAERKEATRDR